MPLGTATAHRPRPLARAEPAARGPRHTVVRATIALAALAALAAVTLAAGCGSEPAPLQARATATSPARQHPGAAVTAPLPTVAGNRNMARRVADRLLARAVVPSGATALRSQPSSLRGPALGMPAVSSVIDVTRSWRLPMTLAQASAWLSAHPPPRLRQDGSTSGAVSNVPDSFGYSYAGPRNPAWASADLEAEVGIPAAGASGTVLRIDAVVIWLDPVPIADHTAGPRLRVTVGGGCPATDRTDADVRNAGGDLRTRLLPAAAPTAGIECFYYGLNDHPFELRKQVALDPGAARKVSAAIARMPLSHAIGAVVNCPMDDGSSVIIALSYLGRPDVDLWKKLNGCATVANGYIETGFQ